MAKNLKADLLNDQIINVLRKFMIFDDLSVEDIRTILSMEAKYESHIAKLCQYNTGETVIKEGDFDCWSFWVVKGVFDVVQNGKTIASFTKSGEIFGEMSVLEGIPRTASVVSMAWGVCLCIDMSVIENLPDDHIRQTIKRGFYKVILKRLDQTKDKMMEEKHRIEVKYADLLAFERNIRAKSKR